MTDRTSPLLLLAALLGIPAAGLGVILFDLQIPRLIYGRANPLLLALEIGSLLTAVVLFLLLRSRLAIASAPRGLYRDVLDFLGMARWHPVVKVALAGLLLLPAVWFVHGERWIVNLITSLGRRALALSDVQDALDTAAVAYQLTLLGGVPLLFMLHLLCRWKRSGRVLPWLFLPMFFLGTAFGVVVFGTLAHFGD